LPRRGGGVIPEPERPRSEETRGRFLTITDASLGGWVGWRLAGGRGMMPAYFAGLAGTVLGIYAARRFLLDLLE